MRSQSYLFQVLEVFVFKSGFGLIFQAHGLSAEGTTKKLIQEASIMFLYGEYEGLGLGFMFTKNGRPRDVGSTQVPTGHTRTGVTLLCHIISISTAHKTCP